MGSTFVEEITQSSGNQLGSTVLPNFPNKIREIGWKNHVPPPLIILELYIFHPVILTRDT